VVVPLLPFLWRGRRAAALYSGGRLTHPEKDRCSPGGAHMKRSGTFVTHDWYSLGRCSSCRFAVRALVIWPYVAHQRQHQHERVSCRFQKKLEKEGVSGCAVRCARPVPNHPPSASTSPLETSSQGLAAVRRAMANAMELDILLDLNFLLPSILAIAKVATMVGLLGTVISMIGTFNEIARAPPAASARRPAPSAWPCSPPQWPHHRHPAGVQPRSVQGVGRQVRGAHEERRPETRPAAPVHKPTG